MPSDGTTAERGYGTQHQNLRELWAPHVATGTVLCWRCGKPIDPGELWDLGHHAGQHRGPEHSNTCNRSAAGLATAARWKHPTERHPGRLR